MINQWINTGTYTPRDFTCGYCDKPVSSEKAYEARGPGGSATAWIYICPRCRKPIFFDENASQTPSVTYGNSVKDIPNESVKLLYEEARKSTGCDSFTAAVLCCRKLLMNIAVSKGAKEGLSFIEYVEYLAANNYIPPDAKGWVDHIRKKGNEANHMITIMKEEDAKDLLSFIEMLLKIIYEFPGTIKKRMESKEQAKS
jgi:hypothetical protein